MSNSPDDSWNLLIKKQKINGKEEYTINRRPDEDT